MPKSQDKTKGARKRHKGSLDTNATESDGSERKVCVKRRKLSKRSIVIDDGIAKSKQLEVKLKTNPKQAYSRKHKNSELKLCGNGKPMPSLSELEKMYEDSDEDDSSNPAPAQASDDAMLPNSKTSSPQTGTSGELTIDKLLSPKTIKRYASKVMDVIVNGTIDIDDLNLPLTVPHRKPKKTGIAYFVGCKERPQVPWQPKTSFCKGTEKYGVQQNVDSDAEDECPAKRKKVICSKSLFNAHSDEIAQRLIELENDSSHQINSGSPDSNKTEDYDCFDKSPLRNITSVFYPIPSTSQDEATILENDRLFNVSLTSINMSSTSEHDIEIIEVPCETVILDDTIPKRGSTNIDLDDDDCCVIVDQDNNQSGNNSRRSSVSVKDEFYGTLDLTADYDNDTCEFIDVDIDDVIAENRAILEKHGRVSDNDVVTLVDPTIPIPVPLISKDDIVEVVACENLSEHANQSSAETKSRSIQSAQGNQDKQPVAPNTNTTSISNMFTNFFNEIVRNNVNDTINLTEEIQESLQRDVLQNRNASAQNQCTSRFENFTGTTTLMDGFGSWMQSQFNGFNPSLTPSPFPSSNASSLERSDTVRNTINVSTPHNTNTTHEKDVNVANNNQTSTSNSTRLGDCPICMESLQSNSVASTMCGHLYCVKCIQAAIKSSGKKCPTCRKTLKGQGYHPIFL